MIQKSNLTNMSVISNIISFISILLINLFPCTSYADVYYGVLRGSESIVYKSPYAGFIDLNNLREGDISESKNIFTIHNYEYDNKKKILLLQIKKEEKQKERIRKQLQDSVLAYQKGFLSHNDLINYEEKLDDVSLSLIGLYNDLNALNNILQLGRINIDKPFIVRDVSVTNHQYVNSGDPLMSIELLDKFFIDIKIDPVVFQGNIKDKNIDYLSLVGNITGKASVARVTGIIDNGSSKSSGMRMVTLLIHGERNTLQPLLDTAFEIKFND
ncbi:hypothetical protein ACEVL2_004884 [Escherichia coli]|nr:hypothetical protein [Escherichia coli]EGE3724964.1 hypothetical protein [Escherichia coli]HBL5657208.1 hypothetical protein [Escherichia coli]HBV6506204.1 hypothetical protein [Escherichia coli]